MQSSHFQHVLRLFFFFFYHGLASEVTVVLNKHQGTSLERSSKERNALQPVR